MLFLKLIVFTLFIFSNGVLCRDRRGSIRHTQSVDDYKFHHPPDPQGYEAIPVAVVYEGDTNRKGKAIENDETPKDNIKEASKAPFKSETGLIEKSSHDKVTKDDQFVTNPTSIEEKGLKVTTYRPQLQKERQIPVAVVYEPEPINYQKFSPNSNRVSNKRKENQQRVTEEHFTDKEININLNAPVNGHTGADYPLSANTQRSVNTRQKLSRPVPKERIGVNHEISATLTRAKTEEQNKPIPAAEETTIPNINKRRKSNRPVPKERTNDTRSSVTPVKAVEQNIQNTEADETTIRNKRRKLTRPTTEETSSAAPGKTEEQNKNQSIQNSVAEEATTLNTNTRQKVTKSTRYEHTKVDYNNSPSDIAQRDTEEENKRKNIRKPVVEETTILNTNKRQDFARPLSEEPSNGKTYKLTSVISVKKEDHNNEEHIQKPAAEETTVPNDDKITSSVFTENALSIPTEKKQEDLHTRQKSTTFRPEQKKETLRSKVLPSVKEHENTASITKDDKSGEFQYPANSEQYEKRDNSSRVREVIPIIQSENLVFSHAGNFKYSYEAGDGTKAFESGELKTFDDETAGEAVRGGFSYTAKDGNEYSLTYTADENGYRPVGAHLPTPPPIPPAIARALAYLATKTTPEPITESIAEQFNDE